MIRFTSRMSPWKMLSTPVIALMVMVTRRLCALDGSDPFGLDP